MAFIIKDVVIIYNVCIFQTSCDDNTGGPANGVNIFNGNCEMNHNFQAQLMSNDFTIFFKINSDSVQSELAIVMAV